MQSEEFKEMLWWRGHELYRDMPWRSDIRPYYVLVSELMLQQTQVTRVVPKFNAFIERFPNERVLADADLSDVLVQWQGLGYNRRAKFLHDAAKMITTRFKGAFPEAESDILALPGVGENTAGAIGAYAFNKPRIFVETNVRTVYIHHFFEDDNVVNDSAIRTLLASTIDTEHPREFYWALMDYGAWLKANGIRTNSRSKHYIKQSPLEGSVRQVRGKIISALANDPKLPVATLHKRVAGDNRFDLALSGLERDGLVSVRAGYVRLTK